MALRLIRNVVGRRFVFHYGKTNEPVRHLNALFRYVSALAKNQSSSSLTFLVRLRVVFSLFLEKVVKFGNFIYIIYVGLALGLWTFNESSFELAIVVLQ